MKINDYMNTMKDYDFAAEFADYDSGEIYEIMQEIADCDISCYTSEQIEHAMNNTDMADYVVSEMLVAESSRYDSFTDYVKSVGVAVWYEENMQTIKDNLEECVLYAVCNALKNQYKVEELSGDQIEELECLIFDEYSRLEDVIEEAAKSIGLIEEDEDEDEE